MCRIVYVFINIHFRAKETSENLSQMAINAVYTQEAKEKENLSGTDHERTGEDSEATRNRVDDQAVSDKR